MPKAGVGPGILRMDTTQKTAPMKNKNTSTEWWEGGLHSGLLRGAVPFGGSLPHKAFVKQSIFGSGF